jgi:hypothetical protein
MRESSIDGTEDGKRDKGAMILTGEDKIRRVMLYFTFHLCFVYFASIFNFFN